MGGGWSAFVKIQKHSARLSLQVIEGLNNISLLFCLAWALLVFLWCISDNLSRCSPIWSGLYLGAMSCILVRASLVHACRLSHPLALSWEQVLHVQVSAGMCDLSRHLSSRLLTSFTSSATILMLYFLSRHQDIAFVIGQDFANGWYHKGSFMRSSGERHIAARFVLYFLAVLSILRLCSPKVAARGPLVGGFQDCVKAFVHAIADVPGGAAAFIRRSVMVAQDGWEGERFR